MLRIVDLLNNIGEDDSQLADAGSRGQVKLGRSVSAPERGASVDDSHEAAMAMMAMVDDDEHAASCPEDKQSSRYAQTRLRSLSRIQEKTTMKRSPHRLSPYYGGSQQQFMTIGNIVNPREPTEASGSSFGSPDRKTDAADAIGGKKRSTRSLFPELSESERRAKQRLIVKRCYYKKINTIKSLRSEADTLEQQFRSALRAMQQQGEAAKAAGHGEDVKLREMFLDTLTTKESLREENMRLRRLADEYYMKNQGRLRQLLDSNHKGLVLFTAVHNDDK
ncbi:uncharacterized protein IUM83_04903 [Phytophthora cinnamomi]|uniref:uncharacterized protein n=1 Tax=Phytophthora cinnamomi TaxID=4785 RepID=UPI003559B4F4|nr:hypothetical protein IUM83_15807 [Phytophthora cinnamomi]KAG6615458.1 hypothetical protein IUM83_04903 [Phytophthora cinnamomi]